MNEGFFICQTCRTKYSKEDAKRMMAGGTEDVTEVTKIAAARNFIDKTLHCKDCGAAFVFTAGEQEFYAERKFTSEPQRCKSCRDAGKHAARAPAAGFSLSDITCDKCNSYNMEPIKDGGLRCNFCGAEYSYNDFSERFDRLAKQDYLQHIACYRCNEKNWGILVIGQSETIQSYAIICKFCGEKYSFESLAVMKSNYERLSKNK